MKKLIIKILQKERNLKKKKDCVKNQSVIH